MYLRKRYIFIVLTSILCCSRFNPFERSGEAPEDREKSLPPVMLSAEADRTHVAPGEIITYNLKIDMDPDIRIELPEFGKNMGGLAVVDFGESGPVTEEGRVIIQKWYRLRPDIMGSYIIPSVSVKYSTEKGEEGELKTPVLFIEVTMGEAGEEAMELRDLKPLIRIPFSFKWWYIALICSGIFVPAGLGALFYYIRLRRRREEHERHPPHRIALEELKELEGLSLIEKGRSREFCFRLSEILRRYLEGRFSFPAMEWTTEQIIPVLTRLDKVERNSKQMAREIFIGTDLVKFAKYGIAEADAVGYIKKTNTFIEKTREISHQDSTPCPRLRPEKVAPTGQ